MTDSSELSRGAVSRAAHTTSMAGSPARIVEDFLPAEAVRVASYTTLSY